MSEPIPAPDKLFARLVAASSILVIIGVVRHAGEIQGGTAVTGFFILVAVLGWAATLGLVYRTRWWQ